MVDIGLYSSSLNTNNSKILRRSFQFPTSVVFRARTVWACQQTGRGGEERGREPLSAWQQPKMADFDAIYEDQDENSSILEAPSISLIPDPVIVRGAGNITVWVVTLLLNSLPLHVTLWLRSPLFVPGLDSQTASTQNFPTCCTQGWRQKSSRYNLQKRQFAQFSQNVTSWQLQSIVAPKSLKYTPIKQPIHDFVVVTNLDNTQYSKHASSAILCRQQRMNFSHMIAEWNQSDDLGTKSTILQVLLTTISQTVSNVYSTIILLCFKTKQPHIVVFQNITSKSCCVSKQYKFTMCFRQQ